MKAGKKRYADKIKDFAEKLEKASCWHHSDRTVGYVENAKQNSYIYEFYCYLRVLSDLKHNYNIKYVQGKGANPHKFPQAAAEKINVPRFEVYNINGKKEFQICTGTRIGNSFGFKLHPDISFQLANASENPTEKDILLIMDAKFKKNASHRLPLDEVFSFSEHVNAIFRLNRKKTPHIKLEKLKNILGNTLLTNGLAHDKNEEYLKYRKIKEVESFDVGKEHNVIG